MYDCLDVIYKCFKYVKLFYVSVWLEKVIATSIFPTGKISIYVGLFTICLHLICASAGLMSCMTLGISFLCQFGSLCIFFVKLLLVFDR